MEFENTSSVECGMLLLAIVCEKLKNYMDYLTRHVVDTHKQNMTEYEREGFERTKDLLSLYLFTDNIDVVKYLQGNIVN